MAIDPANERGKLTLRLGDSGVVASNAAVSLLSAQETEALLARAEPLPALDNGAAPAIRPASAPPPRSGVIQPIAFVAQTGAVIADKPVSPVAEQPAGAVALAMPEILPIGEVRAESEIRVRFAEPMVAIAAVGESKTPIATIKPAVAGTWRWIDTRVAQFTAAGARLPMATDYTVTVPAGTKAISGAVLPSDVTGEFNTPAVQLVRAFPGTTVRPDSPLVVQFDQEVDPTTIVKFLHVEDGKSRKLPFKVTTLDEARKLWARNPSVTQPTVAELGKYHIVIAPTAAWTPGREGRVVLAPKAPSKEGPRVTKYNSGVSFMVAGPFVVQGITCDRVERPRVTGAACAANAFIDVNFSNPVDPATYRSNKVQIAGEPFDDNTVTGASVSLESPLKVGGSYTISVGDGIKDVYGQPMVGGRDLAFTTTRYVHDPFMNARSGMYVLDPRYEIPQWVIQTQAIASIHVELYAVQPSDYFAYEDYEAGQRKTPPGKRVLAQDFTVGARQGASARIDLRPALANGTGHLIAIARATPAAGVSRKLQTEERHARAWIQVTKLGVSARLDRERVHAWTHDLTPSSFLKPINGVQTSLLVEGRTDASAPVTADADGHAAYELLPLIEHKPDEPYRTALLQAKLGNDSAFVAIGGSYEKTIRRSDARWYVTDDRFTYKPGEPLYVKGWVRWTDDGINPVLRTPASNEQLTYSLNDSQGNRIATGNVPFTAQGGFDVEIKLPPNVNLGTAMLNLTTGNRSHRHPISIEEFRTPAYMVNLTDDVMFGGTRPLLLGETISMSTEAKYYAGGGMPGSPISWAARLQSASYKPPGWDRYSFDPLRPRSERYSRYRGTGETIYESTSGTLSGASTSAIEISLAALPQRTPSVLEVDATVTDIDRQTLRATSRKILVHPATRYVGVRLDPSNDRQLSVAVTDIDGNPIAGVPVEVAIEGVLGSERYRDDAEIVDTQSCKLTSAETPVGCTFTRRNGRTAYSAVARIKDSRGRENVAQYDIPWWTWADQDLSVTSDKPAYKPGDVAKLTIKSKTLPASAIVSFARNGVIAQKQVELGDEGTNVELPIVPAYIQNVRVVVDRVSKRRYDNIVNAVPATAQPLPQSDFVEIDLPVDLESARLVMRTRPLTPIVEPGGDATFEVEVKHEDKPVKGAEVALIVVDEAVLAISGKQHADPLEPFYAEVAHGTWHIDNMSMIEDAGGDLGGKPGFEKWNLDTGERWVRGGSGMGYGSGSGRMGSRTAGSPSIRMGKEIRARKDFRATAVFSPKLETNERGIARVSVKMPDSLTRYRVIALATAQTQYFGKAENNIVAQLKVNARTVAPRFLTQGDRFSLPVIVQNLGETPRAIDVAVRAANLEAEGPQGKRVVVPAGERAEVRFDFATRARGKAVIQTVASSGEFADSSNVEVPVYEPATTESFATYGTVTDKVQFEQLKIPTNVFADVGGIQAELASTQLQNLTDAFWYLYAYPFECAEQRSSRMIATTAMYDVLEAFSVGVRPSKQEIADQRAKDIKRLTRDQNFDGGWGYFRDMQSDPFVTMQVLTALALQGDKTAVTKSAADFVTKRFTTLLAGLEKQVKARDMKMTKGQDAADISLAAAALSALAATGTDVSARATKLHAAAMALGSYPVDAKARVLAIVAAKPAHAALREKLLAELLSVVHETAAAATVTASYSDEERLLLVSNPKTTALALDAILREQPQHALVTKLARGLLDGRKRGRWTSTQENLVVLQALRRYFDIYEKDTPNFTGKLWLGASAFAEQTFAGRTTTTAVTHADWSMLAPGTTHDIAIDRSGTGRMYYRLGITYAPKDTKLPPLDAGFVVRRTYSAVDDPSDVVQQPDGTWRVKLGARVLVQLEAINSSARHAVALVDPLPAGFESVNTRLATAERAVEDLTADYWDHTAMRDNRSEAFTMHLREGSHRFSYTARATTPGTFIAAPAKAEEMYSPETFGRSAGTVVVVQ